VGGPVVVCDFEYSWNLNHDDLPGTITPLVPPATAPATRSATITTEPQCWVSS